MNRYAVVLKPAKADLILFVLSVIIAVVAVLGLAKLRSDKELLISQTEQQLNNTRDTIKRLTYDLDSINRLAAKYQQLSRSGFIGTADRDGWVLRLESLYRDTRLPPTLRYTLAPPQLLNPQPVASEAPTAYQNNVSRHDLNLELSGLHEQELIDFIDKLSKDWRAPYRIETCQIARGEASEPIAGLQIKCNLELFSLPEKSVVNR